MNTEREKILRVVLQTISEQFGESTAELYGNYYKDKDEPTIWMSIEELLIENLGKKEAEHIINKIKEEITNI